MPKHLQIKVRPQSGRRELLPPVSGEDAWRAHLKSPPVDGKANEELVALVARYFGCGKAQVRIKAGASGRLKRVEVDDA